METVKLTFSISIKPQPKPPQNKQKSMHKKQFVEDQRFRLEISEMQLLKTSVKLALKDR